MAIGPLITNNAYGIAVISTASLSVVSSFLVILTFVLFSNMRRKLLMKMIAYISICDLIANIEYILPYRPSNGNWQCTLQGFLNLTVYPMSWLWTFALVYCLFYLAHYSRIPMHWYTIHACCWGIPIVLTCICLGFTHLGRTDNFPRYEVCSYYGGLAAEVYHIVFYYSLILFLILLMLLMQYRIWQLEFSNDSRVFNATFVITKTSLYLYPTLLIICWLPHVVLSIVEYFRTIDRTQYQTNAYFLSDIFKIMHGCLTAGVFFYRSAESRKLWKNVICACFGYSKDETAYRDESDLDRDSSLYEETNPVLNIDRTSHISDIETFSFGQNPLASAT